MNSPGPFSILFRQRLPFLSLLALAILGIAVSDRLPLTSVAVGRSGCSLCGGIFCHRSGDCFRTPGHLHIWHAPFMAGTESPAARLAAWVGSRSVPAEVRGVVSSEPRVFSEERSTFEVRLIELRVDGVILHPSFRLLVEQPGAPPAYGDEMSLRGTLRGIEPPRNPGQFDFAAWSARQGVFNRLQIVHRKDAQVLRNSQGNPLVAFALQTRAWLRRTLIEGVNDPLVSDLLVAMVLGDASSLPEHVQEEFRGTGTFHLFSVSGLHVGIMCLLLWYGFKILRVPRRQAAACIIPLLFFYVLMTGLKAASAPLGFDGCYCAPGTDGGPSTDSV